jgi:hypothetical protein
MVCRFQRDNGCACFLESRVGHGINIRREILDRGSSYRIA